ncbi:hypothetical protein EX30DRAFT_166815 [Ascodesmis nigricans]|uniref:Uncharacterized protein n=1 Tax=Ascodesmis nigricans TaxID=341454 RepID=A0A4S2MR49_9PEZI|nr:hypothetical protein EX30DRAFT_166815 [Ascodesmis nigricans]
MWGGDTTSERMRGGRRRRRRRRRRDRWRRRRVKRRCGVVRDEREATTTGSKRGVGAVECSSHAAKANRFVDRECWCGLGVSRWWFCGVLGGG